LLFQTTKALPQGHVSPAKLASHTVHQDKNVLPPRAPSPFEHNTAATELAVSCSVPASPVELEGLYTLWAMYKTQQEAEGALPPTVEDKVPL